MGEQSNKETTLDDVLSSVNNLSGVVNNLSEVVSDLAESVNIFATKTEQRFDGIENRLGKVETEMVSIKSQMVTKDYLDTKMLDMRGDMVVLLRKEDTKVKTLVEILLDRKVISQEDKNKVMALEPFPQLAL